MIIFYLGFGLACAVLIIILLLLKKVPKNTLSAGADHDAGQKIKRKKRRINGN
jgi:hypothetical protein